MAQDGSTISTHVLDTALGRPAAGVHVRLERLVDDGGHVRAGEGVTDADGRIGRLLVGPLTPGAYVLIFELHESGARFFRTVTLEMHIEDVTRSYHVPLLLAPYGITTYRGS
jgi:5-hydroxyisourate hydrolase